MGFTVFLRVSADLRRFYGVLGANYNILGDKNSGDTRLQIHRLSLKAESYRHAGTEVALFVEAI